MAKTASQILDVVQRGTPSDFGEFEVGALKRLYERLPREAAGFLDFVPIRLVTLLETSVRGIVAEAVDRDEDCAARGVVQLSKTGGRGLSEMLRSVSKRQLTLGHVVAHSISTSSVTEIMSALALVFGDNAKNALAAATERWSEDEGQARPLIISDFGACVAMVDRLLTARHVLVHERPRVPPYDADDVPIFLEHVRAFISAMGWLVVERTRGHVPRTQAAMNAWAYGEMAAAKAQLDELTGPVPASLDRCQTLAEKVAYHWAQFSSHAADLAAGYDKPEMTGSIAPSTRAFELQRLTRWRVEDVKRARKLRDELSG